MDELALKDQQRARRVAYVFIGVVTSVFAGLAFGRFDSFQNETFDLAFYSRMAWGLVRLQWWDPLLDAHVFGLHISPVLAVLGAVGALLPIKLATLLLLAQTGAIAACSWPLMRIGEKYLGSWGGLFAVVVWFVHPNLGHVATYEFHPGTLACLPLSWLAWAMVERNAKVFLIATFGVLFCREDLALCTLLASFLFFKDEDISMRKHAYWVAGISLAWVLVFVAILHPKFAPSSGSFEAHFAKWGSSLSSAALYWITHPIEVASHLSQEKRLLFVGLSLAPYAFLPVVKWKWLVPTIPIFAVSLLSDFPTTTDVDSHYITPALPFLAVATMQACHRLRSSPVFPMVVCMSMLSMHVILGGWPGGGKFVPGQFSNIERRRAGQKIVSQIPSDAKVQAPYSLLPHLAERPLLHRTPPPDKDFDFVVLDVSHRKQFFGNESVLRTDEEPIIRTWLAKESYGVVDSAGDWILLKRGHDSKKVYSRFLSKFKTKQPTMRFAECLDLVGASKAEGGTDLHFKVTAKCPNDVAIRIGTQPPRPSRVDLLFNGTLSPAKLSIGDQVRSFHKGIDAEVVWIGSVRSSGARASHQDPVAFAVLVEN